MREVFCGECIYYCPKSRLVNKGELNVSGKPDWYREWLSFCKKGYSKKDFHCSFYKPVK